jgi:hypothetical protein
MAANGDLGRYVFVVGAGFSRALSGAMPLTDELGNLCLEDDGLRTNSRVPTDGFSGGLFETWLSRLADEQPYLTTEENLENQALFLRFSAAIADKLGNKVNDALAEGWPDWLPEFLRLCHYQRSTLLTFNYDPLIECGVGTGLLYDIDGREPVFWAETIGDVPNWPLGAGRFAAEPATTFRLLKLHGSLNWYWNPGDATGVSMARRDLPGIYGAPEAYDDDGRRRELPGRVPFVVPPSATKSPYYRNPIVREVWQQAAAALRHADRLIIMGYSLPVSDLTFAGMLVDSMTNSSAPITVVDRHPEAVVDRLVGLGFHASRIDVTHSPSDLPVAAFVASWRDATAQRLPRILRTAFVDQLDDPLLVYWDPETAASVISFVIDGNDVALTVDSWGTVQHATQSRANRGLPTLLTLNALLDATNDTSRITVVTPDGRRQIIIDASRSKMGIGAGRGVWTVLIASGAPPKE